MRFFSIQADKNEFNQHPLNLIRLENKMKEEKKEITVPCPVCRQPSKWNDNPNKPFCSIRCATKDLAGWADESYRVASEDAPGEGELDQYFH